MLYGQSGVGKSSLLAAGLRPRLEADLEVRYARRDARLGLTKTLCRALGSDEAPQNVWHRLEAERDRPLIVILDQVEEVFTHRTEDVAELDTFFGTIAPLFLRRDDRPRGKLVLSFRKEWLANLETLLRDKRLHYSKAPLLRPLDHRGIVQAVVGLTTRERLRMHYGLEVEDGLADLVADDLLEDLSSPVAPTLQILLTKLWDSATQESRLHGGEPALHRYPLSTVKAERASCSATFWNSSLKGWRRGAPEVVTSGFALDVLALHTTALGTAERRSTEELRALYAHRDEGGLSALLQKCKDLYLLSGAGGGPDVKATRLAHDTLAPLVRRRFDESDLPGQRARRVLEARAKDWTEHKEGVPLDARDLSVVEQGASGMRAWRPEEQRLVTESRKQAIYRQVFTLVFGGALGAGVGLALLRAGVAALSNFPTTWSQQFALNGFWGTLLGAFLCFGLTLPRLFGAVRQRPSVASRAPRRSLLQTASPLTSILLGAFCFGVGSLLLAAVIRGTVFGILRDAPLVLPAGLLTGLGLSAALAGQPWRGWNWGFRSWLRLGAAVLAFALPQLLFVDAGTGGGANPVALSSSYFERNFTDFHERFLSPSQTP